MADASYVAGRDESGNEYGEWWVCPDRAADIGGATTTEAIAAAGGFALAYRYKDAGAGLTSRENARCIDETTPQSAIYWFPGNAAAKCASASRTNRGGMAARPPPRTSGLTTSMATGSRTTVAAPPSSASGSSAPTARRPMPTPSTGGRVRLSRLCERRAKPRASSKKNLTRLNQTRIKRRTYETWARSRTTVATPPSSASGTSTPTTRRPMPTPTPGGRVRRRRRGDSLAIAPCFSINHPLKAPSALPRIFAGARVNFRSYSAAK